MFAMLGLFQKSVGDVSGNGLMGCVDALDLNHLDLA
jgi:hypothetical protein